MEPFEFETKIKDGIIEIPEPYRANLPTQDNVRVIIVLKPQTQAVKFLHHFLDHPITLNSFTPMKREDIYER